MSYHQIWGMILETIFVSSVGGLVVSIIISEIKEKKAGL